MMNTGERQQITFMDVLSIASFLIAVENLDANLTQNDKQDIQADLAERADAILEEIHAHLEKQDHKLGEIAARLEAYYENHCKDG